MTKLMKARAVLNERFRQVMPSKFKEKFGVEIETGWSFLENVVYSIRVDGEALTDEQCAFIAAFETGYGLSLAVLDELIYPVHSET
jgi:hypothetical protein